MSEHIGFNFQEIAPGLDAHLAEYVEYLTPLEIPYEVNTDCDGHHITPDVINTVERLMAHIQPPEHVRGEMWKALLHEVSTQHKAIKESYVEGDPHCDY